MSSRDPWIVRLLDNVLPKDLRHLVGDLAEEHAMYAAAFGEQRATWHTTYVVIRSLPFFFSQTVVWTFMMWHHYLITGTRVVRRNPAFSFINVFGLAASMALCLVIVLFVADQKRYDAFHEKADRTWRVVANYKSPSSTEPSLYASTPAGLAAQMEATIPGIDEAVHVRDGFRGEFWTNGNALSVSGLYAGPDFFELFDFPLVHGDRETALAKPGTILLTPETAAKLYGDGVDPTGEILTAQGGRTFTVTGVVERIPHSHFTFESLVSMATLEAEPSAAERLNTWSESIYDSYTYFSADKEATAQVAASLARMVSSQFQDPSGESVLHELRLQPLTGINLGPSMSNEIGAVIPGIVALFLTGFGMVILLVACFNYISLTMARSTTRNREIGIRRTMGAAGGAIFNQFMLEAVLTAVLALVFSAGLLTWLMPAFNNLTVISMSGNRILIDILQDWWVWVLGLSFAVSVGILAGIYPAIRFTRVNPTAVLSGNRKGGRASRQRFRKSITVVQVAFSIIFVATSIVMIQQFRHMSTTEYGFNRDYIMNVALQDIPYDRFRTAVDSDPDILTVAGSDIIPALGSTHGEWVAFDDTPEPIQAHHFSVNAEWVSVMGLDVVAGRIFNASLASDSLESVVLGRSAVTALGGASPESVIGRTIKVGETPGVVIGVIEDFISADPTRVGSPIVLRWRPDNFRYATLAVQPGRISDVANRLTSIWAGMGSDYTPKYEILDEQLENSPVVLIFGDFIRVFGLFAVFSVLISCLGLFGMAMYSARNRVHEIGIRQALGASQRDITVLLSREYVGLVGLGILLGTPLAWMLNNLWLSQLSNRVTPGPALYAGAVILLVILAVGTVATQTVRAARTKAVDNLNTI